MASAMKGSSSTISTRTLPSYEPAHIVGISKTPYVPATRRLLEWRHDPPPTSANTDPPDSSAPDRRPARGAYGDRCSPRRRVAGFLVLDGCITQRHPSRRAAQCAWRRDASTVWPAYGQAAFIRAGQSKIQAGPNQHAAPIASVAKVMTAYLVLRDHPLRLGEDGPAITLSDADVADTDRRLGQQESVVRRRRRRAIDRAASAAGTAAAVGEQHCRRSGALGRRLGGSFRRPDECCRTDRWA